MASTRTIQQVIAILPASDLERARKFYAEKLGFTSRESPPDGLMFDVGNGSTFLVYQAAGPASGQHTQAGLMVDDLDAVMSDFKSRGVTFEEYDLPGVHTEGGVIQMPDGRAAFFKDSEGNILALNELGAETRARLGM